jgi:predicted nucleic acid-binding Zn ribbon protein
VATSKSSKREKSAERRAIVEQMKREQKRQERRRMILGTSVLVVILVVLVVAVVIGTKGSGGDKATDGNQIVPAAVTGQPNVQKKPAEVANDTGVEGVTAYDTKGYPAPGKADAGTLNHDHVQGTVQYAVTPPVGGPHNGVWMNAGVYTEPVPSERAVHLLEHGAVWITYDPSLSAADVKKLSDFVLKQSMISEGNNENRFMVLSPWADDSLPSKVVLSSWGYQLKLDSVDESRMQDFVDTVRHSQKYTPEYGSAVDGIPVQTGGQPIRGGSKFANPSGAVNGQGM